MYAPAWHDMRLFTAGLAIAAALIVPADAQISFVNAVNISAGSSGVTPSCCIVASADFNVDQVPDLVWQNPSTGAAAVWYMGGANGATIQSQFQVSTGNPWRIVAAVDVDGNGLPDLVWQNPSAGVAQIWYYKWTDNAYQHLPPVFLVAADISLGNLRVVGAGSFVSQGSLV
jgi:hypothetical protein